MGRGSRKGQARWNISLDTGLQRELVGFVANSKVRGGEAWRCLDPAGIPASTWYKMPMWINIETEPPIMSSGIDLAKTRGGWRCHDGISTPMYEKT